MNVVDFISDENLLGRHFEGPTWARWRAVLKAAFALKMTKRDLQLFHEVAGNRPPPKKPVRELVCAVGRGGGKDSVATAIAAYIAVTADTSHLRPGERAAVLLLANGRNQARIAFSYIRSYFETNDLLAGMVERIDADTLQLTNKTEIVVTTNNRRTPRGRTLCAAIYDEVAFWFDESYAHPDTEVDAAVSPGLMRFPGSLKILISSVNRRAGLLYDRVARYHGQNDPDTLVVVGESLQFNETLDAAIIDRELERDYERASAEYLSRWRDDLTTFLDRALVEGAIDRGVVVRPPQAGCRYVGFADPSGGRGDSFTFAIAHMDGKVAIIDYMLEKRAPFSPAHVTEEIVINAKNYGLRSITGDAYAAQWVPEAFANLHLSYKQSERNKSEIYLEALPLFTTGRARLLDSPRLVHQLTALERRSSPVGKDTVSHPDHRNARDDLANAVAGALVLAADTARRGVIIPAAALQYSRNPRGGRDDVHPSRYRDTASMLAFPGR